MMKLKNRITTNKYLYEMKRPRSSYSNEIPIVKDSQPIKDPVNAVSFKGMGSLFYKATNECKDYKKLLQIASKDIDNVADDLLGDLISRGALGKKIFINEEGAISFQEDTFLKSLIDSIIFPIKDVPFLFADFVLKGFKKIPGIKKSAESLYNSNFLSKRREASKMKEDINKIKGVFHNTQTLVAKFIKDNAGTNIDYIVSASKNPKSISDGLYKTSNKYFDNKTGNYNTVHERVLNRIVSGLIPAGLLANDAYNLSVLCGDSKKDSDKEKSARFHQEVSRVLLNAYMQLITLGSLTKFVNKSPIFSTVVASMTVLVAETSSRLINGRPITYISPEKAKDLNKKEKLKEEEKSKQDKQESTQSKPLSVETAKSQNTNESKNDSKAVGIENVSKVSNNSAAKELTGVKNDSKEKKSLITFSTIKKWIGIVVGAGFALSILKNNSVINKRIEIGKTMDAISKFRKNIYKKLVKKEFELSKKDFDSVISKLEETGHKNLAQKYKEIVGDAASDDVIRLFNVDDKGNKTKILADKKIKPFVDIVIEPFKFLIATVKLPYKLVKNVVRLPLAPIEKKVYENTNASKLMKQIAHISEEIFGKYDPPPKASSQDFFAIIVDKIVKKAKAVDDNKITKKEFEEFISSSVASSHNSTTQSNYSNTELGTITKLAQSAVTSSFLISDNYDMVMVKSNGEDKEGAKQKAQERLAQRVSAIFYQTLFMNWFNSVFRNQYHSSLLGMSSVVSVNQVATEVFTRKSVGMPLGAKSYDELVEIDNKNLNRKGLVGSYFRFMSLLTGKKPPAKKQLVGADANKDSKNINPLDLLKKQDKKVATTDLLAIYGSNNK